MSKYNLTQSEVKEKYPEIVKCINILSKSGCTPVSILEELSSNIEEFKEFPEDQQYKIFRLIADGQVKFISSNHTIKELYSRSNN